MRLPNKTRICEENPILKYIAIIISTTKAVDDTQQTGGEILY
jgi:hypothetical protein